MKSGGRRQRDLRGKRYPAGEVLSGLEGEKPIAVDAREADKDLPQRLAAHALHWVAPEAFDLTDDTHLCLRFTCRWY